MTFNYRYAPRNSALREVIADGTIGDVTSVHFEWALDTVHGADYFRRWHRDKDSSGGLLVHKSSHHFDLVNWWLQDTPAAVHAIGGLRFYGAENAARRGLARRPERSTERRVPPRTRSRSTSPGTTGCAGSTSTRSTRTATSATRTCSARASRSRTTSP